MRRSSTSASNPAANRAIGQWAEWELSRRSLFKTSFAGLAAAGTLALPGLGLIAMGPIAAALTGGAIGAATGGLLGGLIGYGIPEEQARRYESGLRQGHMVMGVRPRSEEEWPRSSQHKARATSRSWSRTPRSISSRPNAGPWVRAPSRRIASRSQSVHPTSCGSKPTRRDSARFGAHSKLR